LSTPFTFSRARCAQTADAFVVIAVPDDMHPYYPFGRFCWYVAGDPSDDRWAERRLDFRVHGITAYQRLGADRRFCIISAEGDVVFIETPKYHEKIPGAGIHSPDSKYWGRMENMRAIGERLYACGDGGQVYRRSIEGVWTNLDPSLLQGPSTPVADRDIFMCIDGPNENEIYVVGRFGKILFWNGHSFRRIPSGSEEQLIDIHVESPDKIWACGHWGTLICGNYRDGFRQVPAANGGQLFQSLTMFEGKIYLGAGAGRPMGLMSYDGMRFEKVRTGLSPEVDDSHSVDSANGVLWSVGLKDIVRFDGKTWERIDFPGNTPIR
jgi:hypothetical protein